MIFYTACNTRHVCSTKHQSISPSPAPQPRGMGYAHVLSYVDARVLNSQWWIQDFPLGGRRVIGGHQPLMWVLFGKNVCENERIGSPWGGTHRQRPPLDPPMNRDVVYIYQLVLSTSVKNSIHKDNKFLFLEIVIIQKSLTY